VYRLREEMHLPHLPVTADLGLKNQSYCTRGSEKASGMNTRSGVRRSSRRPVSGGCHGGESDMVMVTKRDGRREAFVPEKIVSVH